MLEQKQKVFDLAKRLLVDLSRAPMQVFSQVCHEIHFHVVVFWLKSNVCTLVHQN